LVLDDPALTTVDRTIAECNPRIRLFYHLAPTNEVDEKTRFLDHRRRSGRPNFVYRPLDFDPKMMRTALGEAPVDDIEDEMLRPLYADKIWELEKLVTLLQARGSAHFLESSREVFGRPPATLVDDARRLLSETTYLEERDLGADEVRQLLETHLGRYSGRYGEFDCEVVLDGAMSAKMYVHENRIHVKQGALFSRQAALCDTVHEIDAHVLTFLNGRDQPLQLFEVGPRGTLAFQESLGVFTEIANGVMFPGRMIALATRVVAVASMIDGAQFADLFEELTAEYGVDDSEAFVICVRVFRGGGFTKDWLYVAELERIVRHWADGRDMGLLLLAKVTMDTVDDVENLVSRGVLRPARYLPPFLDTLSKGRSHEGVRPQLNLGPVPIGDLLTLDFG
jgi:uncharacterized protein (TIGR02421 family)